MGGVVHLRAYTEYSLLYSAARVEQLAACANDNDMMALGVVDRGMHGTVSAYRTLKAAGVQPIIGQTVSIVQKQERAVRPAAEPLELVLLATSFAGYRSLCALSSASGLAATGNGEAVNTWADIARHSAGLICLTGGRRGPLQAALTRGQREAERIVRQLQEWFGAGQVYVELQNNGTRNDAVHCRAMAEVAAIAGVPMVATSPIRHITAEDIRLVDVLQAVKGGTSLQEAAGLRAEGELFGFRTQAQMRELFREFPVALAMTEEVAARTHVELPLHEWNLPRFPLPAGQTEDGLLCEIARSGLQSRIPCPSEAYKSRLEYELEVIRQLGFSGYFLVVWDFMRYAHEHAISTGPGRGSAAGSLVAYALSITDVDPLRFNLLFERFLNPERVSWPDIDIDFETERRYEVIRYVTKKYGADHVAQVGTLGTFAARAAIRDVARVLAVPAAQANPVLQKIPSLPGSRIDDAFVANAGLRAVVDRSPALSRVIELARGIEGLPRHASIHAAGVVIAKDPLSALVPVMQGAEGIPVTQYSMEDIEALGLLKMDFLGLRTLTICDRAVRYIAATRGIKVQYDALTMDDATVRLLSSGDTDGCFQLESAGVKQVLREMQPTELEDLIAVISLYRPGPMEQISTFIKARRGDIPVRFEVSELAPILAPTYGILVYQEQVMQIAAAMAGFSLGEADVLRRAIGKKKRDVLDEARVSFVQGCLVKGHGEHVANQVYDLIVRFADYGFNRSHAAAYAVLAHRTAHLKANFRPEFMAALITDTVSRPEKVAQYALACRREGVPILGPDVNHSLGDCSPEPCGHGVIGVRLGLFTVKNVGVAAVESIIKERDARGTFGSLVDLYQRLDARSVTRRVFESLIQAGALDGMGHSRNDTLRELEVLSNSPRERSGDQLSFSLAAGRATGARAQRQTQVEQPDDPEQVEAWERDLIGFAVSRDPYEAVERWQQELGLASLRESLETSAAGSGAAGFTRFVGKVVQFRSIKSKRGEPMGFLTLEDATAKTEVVVFPAVFRLLDTTPVAGQSVEASVRLDNRQERSWIVSRLRVLGSLPEQLPTTTLGAGGERELFIKVSAALEREREQLSILRQKLLEHAGPDRVVLVYESGKLRVLDAVSVAITPDLVRAIQALVGREAVKVKKKNNRSEEE